MVRKFAKDFCFLARIFEFSSTNITLYVPSFFSCLFYFVDKTFEQDKKVDNFHFEGGNI